MKSNCQLCRLGSECLVQSIKELRPARCLNKITPCAKETSKMVNRDREVHRNCSTGSRSHWILQSLWKHNLVAENRPKNHWSSLKIGDPKIPWFLIISKKRLEKLRDFSPNFLVPLGTTTYHFFIQHFVQPQIGGILCNAHRAGMWLLQLIQLPSGATT